MFGKCLNFLIAIGTLLVLTAIDASARRVVVEILPSVEVTESHIIEWENSPIVDDGRAIRNQNNMSERQLKLGGNETVPPWGPANIVGAPCVQGTRPDAIGACRQDLD